MDDNEIGIFKDKKYKPVEFKATKIGDTACNHCAFELGKCRAAIWVLGQCYIVEDGVQIKNIYYEEVKEEEIKEQK